MASLSLYPHFETNVMSNRKVIELLLQLKSAKAHGKNYIKPRGALCINLDRDAPPGGYFPSTQKNNSLQISNPKK